MRAEDIALVSSICRTRAGLKVAPEKTYLMESRLSTVARREGFGRHRRARRPTACEK